MARTAHEYGLLGGVGLMFAAFGGHWLITPIRHPEATTFEYGAAWAQILAGLALYLWTGQKARALGPAPESPTPRP